MTDLCTATEALDKVTLWKAADDALAVGKSYTIGNRQLTRADAAEVRANLSYWSRTYRSLQAAANSNVKDSGYRVGVWT